MTLSAKRESLARIHGRYERAGRPHKTRILEEFCATCGYHRKAALRLLNRPLRTTPPKRSGPKLTYDPLEVLPVLKAIWLASDQLCSKLLKAALPEWLEHHERRTTPLPEAFSPTSATGAGDGLGVVAITAPPLEEHGDFLRRLSRQTTADPMEWLGQAAPSPSGRHSTADFRIIGQRPGAAPDFALSQKTSANRVRSQTERTFSTIAITPRRTGHALKPLA